MFQDNAGDETNDLGLNNEHNEEQNAEQSDDSVSIKTDSESSLFGQSPSQATQDIAQQAWHAQGKYRLNGHQDPPTADHTEENWLIPSANEQEDPNWNYDSMQEGSPIPQIESDLPQNNVQESFDVPVPQRNSNARPRGARRKPKGKGQMWLSTDKWTARKKKGLDGRTLATSVGPSDEDVRGQPDVRYLDESLVMVLDGPLLRQYIHRIEADHALCFKMRWYVARHIRKNFKKSVPPSGQDYCNSIRAKAAQVKRYRVLAAHSMSKDGTPPTFGGRPINRLDFEATRATVGFTKNQPGWAESDFTLSLQTAYDKEGWSEFVTEADVDDVLRRAGADLDAFTNAPMIADRSPTPPQVSSDNARVEVNLAQLQRGRPLGDLAVSNKRTESQGFNLGEKRKRGRPTKAEAAARAAAFAAADPAAAAAATTAAAAAATATAVAAANAKAAADADAAYASRRSLRNIDAEMQALRNDMAYLKQTVIQERQSREFMEAEIERIRQSFQDELRREKESFMRQIADFRANALSEMLEEQNTFHAALAADHESFQKDTLAEMRKLRET